MTNSDHPKSIYEALYGKPLMDMTEEELAEKIENRSMRPTLAEDVFCGPTGKPEKKVSYEKVLEIRDEDFDL